MGWSADGIRILDFSPLPCGAFTARVASFKKGRRSKRGDLNTTRFGPRRGEAPGNET